MSDEYATVDIPKSLPIHGVALTSTGRKIEHNKVVVETQTYESDGVMHETLTFKDNQLANFEGKSS